MNEFENNFLDQLVDNSYYHLCTLLDEEYNKIDFFNIKKNILKNVSKENYGYTEFELERLSKQYLNYSSECITACYKQGIKDVINLIYACLNKKED